jgi:transposase
MADKGYDSDAFRTWLANRGTLSALRRAGIERPRPLSSKASYRKRHLVENFFERIKNFRRVATRCALDKYVSQRG